MLSCGMAKRTARISVYVSPGEAELLRHGAGLFDMSLSEFVRACALAAAHEAKGEEASIDAALTGLALVTAPAEA